MKQISLKEFHGVSIFIRDDSPDRNVAQLTLGNEFSYICNLLSNVNKPNIILDFGGYIGSAAIKFATSIPHSVVVTVEPSPDNFSVLDLNTAFYGNIVPVNAAVGSRRGALSLYSRGTGEWGFTLVSTPNDRKNPREVATVDVLTVSDILALVDKYPISLVKIDIEGSEVDLLRECDWIDRAAIVVAELHDRITDGCTEAWKRAAEKPGRLSISPNGEKVISVSPSLVRSLCS